MPDLLIYYPFLAICERSLDHEQISLQVLFSSASWKPDKPHWSVELQLASNSYPHAWVTVNTYQLLLSYVMDQIGTVNTVALHIQSVTWG